MVINILHCKKGKVPFVHLGIPVGGSMVRVNSWAPIVDKFQKKLSLWRAKLLSFGGRLTLIKNVLGSLPIYYLSIFKIPSSVVNKLEGIRRRFLWGGGSDKLSIPWVK